MNFNGYLTRHLYSAFVHILVDGLLFFSAFVIATFVRFQHEWVEGLVDFMPGYAIGAVIYPCTAYILGLYAPTVMHHGPFRRAMTLSICLMVSISAMLAALYFHMLNPVGRGILLIGAGSALVASWLHHLVILDTIRKYKEKFAVVVSSPDDVREFSVISRLETDHMQMLGAIVAPGLKVPKDLKVLGELKDLRDIASREGIDRLICSKSSIKDERLYRQIAKLRYSGVRVMPLISVFEEINQCVPLELISANWLLEASGIPHILYIRKVKRFFDVLVSLVGLLLSSPVVAVASLVIKLSSPGPVFYRQVRVGKFGRLFTVIKLRTMHQDAEKDGVVWSVQGKDPRAFAFGAFLRRYRIDEIPQMLNVLRGEMSFVGPRPERPHFVDSLSGGIPYYDERHMTQPGITGWAQVCYPYGASVDDAKRKLEYDLYYMKHMSLFIDLFILLDTVRTVLFGGVSTSETRNFTASPFPSYTATEAREASALPAMPAAIPARVPAASLRK